MYQVLNAIFGKKFDLSSVILSLDNRLTVVRLPMKACNFSENKPMFINDLSIWTAMNPALAKPANGSVPYLFPSSITINFFSKI